MVGVLGVTTALYGGCTRGNHSTLWCIFVHVHISLCVGMKAITADIYPKEIKISYNKSAAVSCKASPYVAGITFVVAGVDRSMWSSRGISQSAPTYSGSNTTTTLTVQGIMDNDGLKITCRVIVGSSYEDISPPAVVKVEGW